jgi:hypothetical protein
MHALTRVRKLLGRALFLASIPPLRRLWRSRSERPGDVPPVGLVRFGDLRSLEPVSRVHGDDRGRSIRDHYVAAFLAEHGSDRDGALVVEDARTLEQIAPASQRLIIMTRGFEHADDPRPLLHSMHQSLRPGGIALVAGGGIAPNGRTRSGDAGSWAWHYTALSMRRLFGEIFGPDAAAVTTYGNVLSAAAYLQGISAEELTAAELDHHDPDYELLIGVRAERSGAT